jgi:hypothetical protein
MAIGQFIEQYWNRGVIGTLALSGLRGLVRFSFLDKPDTAFRNVEYGCDFFITHSTLRHFANFNNFTVFKLRVVPILSPATQTDRVCVLRVFGWCAVLKIVSTIVQFVAVNMVDLVFIRSFTYKSLSDKRVNVFMDAFS